MSDMITLTENQISILGRPNFACADVAKLLMKMGVYEQGPPKAEYEQAVYIHWASDLLDKHGDNWKEEASKILKDLISKLETSPDIQKQRGPDDG